MIKIQGGNITVMVTDMDAAVRFYTEILGLTLKHRYGDHWADIEGPGLAIGLHPSGSLIKKGDNLQIGLKVSDLDNAVSELEQKGVKFNLNDDDQVRLASFSDPDDNVLYLVQTE